jgi:two-component system KDP operon response regulator KdpE
MPCAKIMIVDDELDLVRALTLRFKSAGYDVIHATDGVVATQVAVREQPDVIVLDVGLPGGDGHTVADRLRKNVKSLSIPVVYLTARSSDADRQRAATLGAAAYLTKPFKAEQLLNIVTRLVHGVATGIA